MYYCMFVKITVVIIYLNIKPFALRISQRDINIANVHYHNVCNVDDVKNFSKSLLPLKLVNPTPLELQEVEWIIVTEENIEEVWQLLKDKNEGVALFALRHGDYERLALNIKDIRAQLGEYIVILKKYREYYESE